MKPVPSLFAILFFPSDVLRLGQGKEFSIRYQSILFSLLYTSLTLIAANHWLSAHAGSSSGAKMVQSINSIFRSVALRGPSRGGIFGCRVLQAHMMVVERHPQTMSNNVRLEQRSEQVDSAGVEASAPRTTNRYVRIMKDRKMSRDIRP